jgi:membrane protease YdiL (CAAX protease family)
MSHTFFYPVLLAPLIEEIIYRLWFLYSKTKLSLSIAILVPFFTIYLAKCTLNVQWSNLFFISIGASLVTIFPLSFFLLKRYENQKFIPFWEKNKKIFIIISSIVFGLMHIGNYIITPKVILYSPVLFLPYIFTGFIFSYTRIRIGFFAGVICHSLHNFVIYLIYFFYKIF